MGLEKPFHSVAYLVFLDGVEWEGNNFLQEFIMHYNKASGKVFVSSFSGCNPPPFSPIPSQSPICFWDYAKPFHSVAYLVFLDGVGWKSNNFLQEFVMHYNKASGRWLLSILVNRCPMGIGTKGSPPSLIKHSFAGDHRSVWIKG